MKNIAIFASGSGSNALSIITYLHRRKTAKVSCIICNNPKAGVIQKAAQHQIPTLLIDKTFKNDPSSLIIQLQEKEISWIALAGFLWKVPPQLIDAFPKRIINIHPSLLPLYGGKGMYGMHVHRAVIENKESESGLTIHYVNEQFDKGEHIAQFRCAIEENDTPESLAARVLSLEHKHYPIEIEKILLS